jgi:hypothetical protein
MPGPRGSVSEIREVVAMALSAVAGTPVGKPVCASGEPIKFVGSVGYVAVRPGPLSPRCLIGAAKEGFVPKKKMWVEWEDGSDLSKSHKKPGAKSPLTRDNETNELGQVTLEDIEDDDPEPEIVCVDNGLPQPTWWEQVVADAVRTLIEGSVEIAKPVVANWWDATAVPYLKAKREHMKAKRAARKALKSASKSTSDHARAVGTEPCDAVAVADPDETIKMTSEQLEQLKFMASDEFRARLDAVIANAQVEDEDPAILEQLAEARALPSAQRAERVFEILTEDDAIHEVIEDHFAQHQVLRPPTIHHD